MIEATLSALQSNPQLPQSNNLFDLLLKIGSISGLIGIFYQIHNNRLNRPSFEFTFESSHAKTYRQDSLEFCDYHFSGIIRNKSLKPNSIVRLYLTVWNSKKKSSVLRFGFSVKEVTNLNTSEKLYLPLKFSPKEAYRLNVVFNFPLTGTQDEKLFKSLSPVGESGKFYLPKYRYEFLMEDTSKNLYDYSNSVFNIDIINRWWTLPNFSKKPFLYFQEVIKLILDIIRWKISNLISAIGFYK